MVDGTIELFMHVRDHLGGASTAHESIPGHLGEATIVRIGIFHVNSLGITTHRLEFVASWTQASQIAGAVFSEGAPRDMMVAFEGAVQGVSATLALPLASCEDALALEIRRGISGVDRT